MEARIVETLFISGNGFIALSQIEAVRFGESCQVYMQSGNVFRVTREETSVLNSYFLGLVGASSDED